MIAIFLLMVTMLVEINDQILIYFPVFSSDFQIYYFYCINYINICTLINNRLQIYLFFLLGFQIITPILL